MKGIRLADADMDRLAAICGLLHLIPGMQLNCMDVAACGCPAPAALELVAGVREGYENNLHDLESSAFRIRCRACARVGAWWTTVPGAVRAWAATPGPEATP